MVGPPSKVHSHQIQRRFLLRRDVSHMAESDSYQIISQGYLKNPELEHNSNTKFTSGIRIRSVFDVKSGSTHYYWVCKQPTHDSGVYQEITGDMCEAEWLKNYPRCERGLDFVLNSYKIEKNIWTVMNCCNMNVTILQLETLDDTSVYDALNISIPEIFSKHIVAEVTGDRLFSNYMLADKNWSSTIIK